MPSATLLNVAVPSIVVVEPIIAPLVVIRLAVVLFPTSVLAMILLPSTITIEDGLSLIIHSTPAVTSIKLVYKYILTLELIL